MIDSNIENKKQGLNILVVGAGMYVCGKGTDSLGTILPSLVEAKKSGLVDDIIVAATSDKSIEILNGKLEKINNILGANTSVIGYPQEGRDDQCYLRAINEHNIDCAIVSVPDHLHTSITENLIKKGFHVLVVKPLAPTVEEVKHLISLAEERKVYGAVEFHKRYDRSNLKFRENVREGKIGLPLYFHVEFSQKKRIPEKVFKGWVAQSNIFQYLGVHYADMIYFITGALPERVLALGQKKYLASRQVDTYDAIETMIEWKHPETKDAFISTILTNWIDPESSTAMSDQKIKVIGTKGRFESDQKNRGNELLTDENGAESINPYFSSFFPDINGKHKVFQGYGYESIRQFLKDVQDLLAGLELTMLTGLRPTFKDALVSTLIVDAVNKSLSSNGNWINIEE
ncbi:Gfo/Idh/MocA family protein [Candidatus Margulisiibacteriota bacterium]